MVVYLLMFVLLTSCQSQPDIGIVADFNPKTIEPNDSVTITYTINYDGVWNDITGVEIAGFPDNTGNQGVYRLTKPRASGVQTTAMVTVAAPASDGIFGLSIRVHWTVGNRSGTKENLYGDLAIQDVPAILTLLAVTPNQHSIQVCQAGPPQFPVAFRYTLTDNNGADDVYSPIVSEVSGPSIHLPHVSPPIPLTAPSSGDRFQTSKAYTTHQILVNCDVALGQYTWTMEANEDDKANSIPARQTLRESAQPPYTVNP